MPQYPPPSEEGLGDLGCLATSSCGSFLFFSPCFRTPAKAFGRLALSGKVTCLTCLLLSGVSVLWGAEAPRISFFFLSRRSLMFQGCDCALVPLFFGMGIELRKSGGFKVFLEDSQES